MPVKGFREHVPTDGPCWAVFGKWCARGWSVVQLYHDEETGANAWMHGTLDADFEVQRAIEKSGLTAWLCHR